jgi:hypothetical protein
LDKQSIDCYVKTLLEKLSHSTAVTAEDVQYTLGISYRRAREVRKAYFEAIETLQSSDDEVIVQRIRKTGRS